MLTTVTAPDRWIVTRMEPATAADPYAYPWQIQWTGQPFGDDTGLACIDGGSYATWTEAHAAARRVASVTRLLVTARDLTEHDPRGANREYDRALVELLCDLIPAQETGDVSDEDKADTISRFVTGRPFDQRG
jgi:hypothetical protein